MLNLKDRLYIGKLIKSGKLYITEQDRVNLKEEDIRKIKYIEKKFVYNTINFEILKKFTFYSNLEILIGGYDIPWCIIEERFNEGFKWQLFIDKIARVYLRSSIYLREPILKMIKAKYSIEQIEFLITNRMIYSFYHKQFDYDVLLEECEKIGYDFRLEFCNNYTIDFLKVIPKYNISDKYCQKILDGKPNSITFEEYDKILYFLTKKGFSEYEILLVAPKKNIEELEIYFKYGGTKEELVKALILNS